MGLAVVGVSHQAGVDGGRVEGGECRGAYRADAGRHGGAVGGGVGSGGGEASQDQLDVLHHLVGAEEAADCQAAAREGRGARGAAFARRWEGLGSVMLASCEYENDAMAR